MKDLVGIVAAFIVIAILAFLGINWVSTVPEPTNTTSDEYQVYQNLSNTTELAFTGQEAVILLVIVAMVFIVFMLLAKWFIK